MTIEELNRIKASVRQKAEKAAYCRGLEAGRKEQKAKDKYVIECIEEEHHYDKVFLKEKLIDKACEWLNDNLYPTVKTNFDNIVEVQSTQDFLMLFRKIMEE